MSERAHPGVSAAEVIELLGLEPLPHEGGMWAPTWRDDNGSGIYFMMQPGDYSAMHRLSGPELWHYYAGAPAQMLLLHPDGSAEKPMLGDDLTSGARPCIPIPAGVWMGASTAGEWTLVGATMAPPFEPAMFELGAIDDLKASHPDVGADIAALVRVETA